MLKAGKFRSKIYTKSTLNWCGHAALIFLIAVFACPTYAVLGDKISGTLGRGKTVVRALAGPEGAKADTTGAAVGLSYQYRDSQIGLTTLREFVDASGVIFAISWHGHKPPDLQAELGEYYSEFVSAAENQPRNSQTKKVSNFKSSKLVIRQAGHMRDLRGFIVAPNLVPVGVNIEELPR